VFHVRFFLLLLFHFMCSGSDCGRVFIWQRDTGKLLNVIEAADSHIVNAVASHPTELVRVQPVVNASRTFFGAVLFVSWSGSVVSA
jgi:hypothetical protein